jgi:glycosyltransferase involved in cell wall biosynthesis
MVEFAIETLRADGCDVELAYYEPYSQSPELSTPSFALGRRRPGIRIEEGIGRTAAHAMGAWLPELEFTHYWPRQQLRELMERYDAHLVVSGNALAGTALVRTGKAYAAWIATDFDGDRVDRVATFGWPRRLLDAVINAPVARRLERQVLQGGMLLALSQHTARQLTRIAGAESVANVLPAPIDTDHFSPTPESIVARRVGFSGRLADPRKNLPLLLDALSLVRARGNPLSAVLIGGGAGPELVGELRRRGLSESVETLAYLDRPALVAQLRKIDVFALPSHQEGLCIAALEAMACGVPVVSTRCGGPEDYVVDDENGYLVNADPDEMAEALTRICGDRRLRERLGQGARSTVQATYSKARAADILRNSVRMTMTQPKTIGGCS